MNRIYRLVRDSRTGALVPVSELTRSRGKPAARIRRAALPAMLALACAAPAMAVDFTPDGNDTVIDDETIEVPAIGQPANWSLPAPGYFIIGKDGTAALVAQDASAPGDFYATGTILGLNAGASGTVVLANGSQWDGTSLVAGNRGKGTFDMASGAQVEFSNVSLGDELGGDGSVTLSGSGTSLRVRNGVDVGVKGTGVLALADGASARGSLTAGKQAGSTGRVEVRGSGTRWTAGDVLVGDAGSGRVEVTDGARVEVAFDPGLTSGKLGLGLQSTGHGKVLVSGSGSRLDSANGLSIGHAGSGEFQLRQGASSTIGQGGPLVSQGNEVSLATLAGSQGLLDVSGAGTSFTAGSGMVVGRLGEGTLRVSDGALVTVAGQIDGSSEKDALAVGFQDGGRGVVEVRGADSTLKVSGWLSMAGSSNTSASVPPGDARLEVDGGGSVEATNVILGWRGDATARIDGPGTRLVVDEGLYIATSRLGPSFASSVQGQGELQVSGGASVRTGLTNVGDAVADEARVVVEGDGTRWVNTGDFTVGSVNNATLSLDDGARLQVDGQFALAASRSITGVHGAAAVGVLNIGSGGKAGTLVTDSVRSFALDTSDPATVKPVVNFNHTDDIEFTPQLLGYLLTVNKLNTGTTRLMADNAYTGATSVTAGTLAAGQAGAFSALSAHAVGSHGTLSLGGFDQTVLKLENAGTVAFAGQQAGTTLTVTGDYIGNGGTLAFNTVLAGDTAATDKLVIQGNSSGTSKLVVNNLGGTGAQTVNGILLVQVDGDSAGQFILQGRAVAGGYEYSLHQGALDASNNGDWYLRSIASAPAPVPPPVTPPPVTPPPVTPPPVSPPPVSPPPVTPVPPDPAAVLRVEAAPYLNNQNAAMVMFQSPTHERRGAAWPRGLDGERAASVWVNGHRSQLDAGVIGEQIDVSTDANVVTVGADMGFALAGGLLEAGIMLGKGRAVTDALSNLSGYAARGEVEGAMAGVYATWYHKADTGDGLYLDAALQYGRYDNDVAGQGLRREQYDADGWSASVEAGYAIAFHQGRASTWYVEPQAQLLYGRYQADDFTEANGTRISGQDEDATRGRLGLRLYTRSHATARAAGVQPYVALNWWTGGNEAGVAMGAQKLRHTLADDLYELRLGAALELAGGWGAWGSVGVASAQDGYHDATATLGLRYSW